MSTQPKTFLTPEQYLEIEREAEYKSEYYQGEMFAMAGAGEAHNRAGREPGSRPSPVNSGPAPAGCIRAICVCG